MGAAFLSDGNTQRFYKMDKLLNLNTKQKDVIFKSRSFYLEGEGRMKVGFFDFLTRKKKNY